jgi:hypothetical protein
VTCLFWVYGEVYLSALSMIRTAKTEVGELSVQSIYSILLISWKQYIIGSDLVSTGQVCVYKADRCIKYVQPSTYSAWATILKLSCEGQWLEKCQSNSSSNKPNVYFGYKYFANLHALTMKVYHALTTENTKTLTLVPQITSETCRHHCCLNSLDMRQNTLPYPDSKVQPYQLLTCNLEVQTLVPFPCWSQYTR